MPERSQYPLLSNHRLGSRATAPGYAYVYAWSWVMEIIAYAILDTRRNPPTKIRRFKASVLAGGIILGQQMAGMNRQCREERYALAEIYANGSHKIIGTPPGPETWVGARVKWFSHAMGYGFVEAYGFEDDIFVHARTVPRNILRSIACGDAVQIQYVKVERGYHAVALKLPEGGGDE
jgi:cold shock CspA family protein